MKNIICYLTLLMIYGCSSGITSSSVHSTCPEKPINPLDEKDVEQIDLDEKTLSKSDQASANKSIGYKFAAKSGQKFSFSTDSDICVWVYAPDNQILKGSDLPQTGNYLIQISALKGSKTFDINMSLGVVQAATRSTSKAPVVNSVRNSTISTYTPRPTSGADLTQEQALNIVKQWYAAKPQIFAPPFDTSLVDQLATGKLHENTTNSDPESGSIAWLQANNSYYKYNQSEIRRVIDFSNSGKEPYIKLRVFEELYFYGSTGNIDRKHSGTYENTFIYFFEKDSNGIWKISDYSKF